MPHFFIPPANIHGKLFTFTGPEVHHLLDVRRCAPGDVLHLFDGTGKTYVGKVEQATREAISGTIIESGASSLPLVKVHLYQAVPKGDRFDWLVEKAAELGITNITPLVTERSVVKDISAAKQERWKRLALAACQQCSRPDILTVGAPELFAAAVTTVKDTGVSIIPWEGEDTRTLEEALQSLPGARVNVFIGPEGGFSLNEVDLAGKAGIAAVTLGPRILRVETAGLLASILVLNAAGEFRRRS